MKQLLVGFALGLLCASLVVLRDDGRADAADQAIFAVTEAAAPQAGSNCGCPGDLSGDSQVNVSDLLLLLGAWGACSGCQSNADCDDGLPCTVDFCDGSTCVNDPIPGCCFFGDECDPGESCCNGACIDVQSDTNHCGGCNLPCGPEEVCEDGNCVSTQTWYRDEDGDGWGQCGDFITSAKPVEPYTAALCGDCDDADPQAFPGAIEVCDGVDNDCNGVIDDVQEKGSPCNTGMAGQCEAGALTCNNGLLVCEPIIGPSQEVCDGIDNDCNGVVDDIPDEGSACETCMVGQCADGILTCEFGQLTCDPIFAPSPEICDDGIDNSCNGLIDCDDPACDGHSGCP